MAKAWSVNEVPSRAPPLPEDALFDYGGLLHVQERAPFRPLASGRFYGILRTGEMLSLQASDISVGSE